MRRQLATRKTDKIIPWAVSGPSQHGPTRGIGGSDGHQRMIFTCTFPQVSGLIRTVPDGTGHRRRTSRPVSRVLSVVRRRPGDHPSRAAVADNLMRPTRELGRAALERSLSDLAPGGVCRAAQVTLGAGGLLHHRFTLTAGCPAAVCFLWHFPAGHPGWALPTTLPCGARTFLGEQPTVTNHRSHSTRPPGRLVRRADRVAVLRPSQSVRTATRRRP
jgi:hypothetical protein